MTTSDLVLLALTSSGATTFSASLMSFTVLGVYEKTLIFLIVCFNSREICLFFHYAKGGGNTQVTHAFSNRGIGNTVDTETSKLLSL